MASPLISAARLRAVYVMLQAFKPFSEWKLPPSSEVKFGTFPEVNPLAFYGCEDRHEIRFSSARVWNLYQVTVTMAHEMAHLKQNLRGKLPDAEAKHHNAEFHRICQRICQELGFPPEDIS